MKYLPILVLIISTHACRTSAAEPVYENEIYFEYENLQTGETGTVDNHLNYLSNMYSTSRISGDTLTDTFSQGIQVKYFLNNEVETSWFSFYFFPPMLGDLVKPLAGQVGGQLYTYIDPQDYLNEGFLIGDLFTTSTELKITYSPIYAEYSDASTSNLVNQEEVAHCTITHHAIFTDDLGRPNIYIEGTFSGILTNNSFSGHFGQEQFRITNGRFQFSHPVDEPQ